MQVGIIFCCYLRDLRCDLRKRCGSERGSYQHLQLFTPKIKFHEINPKNLELITRIFFNHRRKMLKKPFNQIFNGNQNIINKLKLDLNLRPQNLDYEVYYQLTKEYENLIG